jgi:hypothetical protein
MKIYDLILLAENCLATLNNARATAVSMGQQERLPEIDKKIVETEDTLLQLRSL